MRGTRAKLVRAAAMLEAKRYPPELREIAFKRIMRREKRRYVRGRRGEPWGA